MEFHAYPIFVPFTYELYVSDILLLSKNKTLSISNLSYCFKHYITYIWYQEDYEPIGWVNNLPTR